MVKLVLLLALFAFCLPQPSDGWWFWGRRINIVEKRCQTCIKRYYKDNTWQINGKYWLPSWCRKNKETCNQYLPDKPEEPDEPELPAKISPEFENGCGDVCVHKDQKENVGVVSCSGICVNLDEDPSDTLYECCQV